MMFPWCSHDVSVMFPWCHGQYCGWSFKRIGFPGCLSLSIDHHQNRTRQGSSENSNLSLPAWVRNAQGVWIWPWNTETVFIFPVIRYIHANNRHDSDFEPEKISIRRQCRSWYNHFFPTTKLIWSYEETRVNTIFSWQYSQGFTQFHCNIGN